MKKFLIFILLINIFLYGANKNLLNKTNKKRSENKKKTTVMITADEFRANENSLKSTFLGHVKIVKKDDKIFSNIVTIFFDKDKKPIKYEAKKNVKFTIKLKDSFLDGSANRLVYVPKSNKYILEGKVDVKEFPQNRKIQASKVIINLNENKIDIFGEKNRPVKFIFEVEDKEE